MGDFLLVLTGIAAGAYFAEEIRAKVPVLDKTEK